MQCPAWSLLTVVITAVSCLAAGPLCAEPLTWQEVRAKFISTNPTLQAARIGVDETRAQEITANMRPNPEFTVGYDNLHPWRKSETTVDVQKYVSLSYLFERMNKRALRRESAEKETRIAVSQTADLERNLLFTLRSAFIQVLQQKAALDLAKENLLYYDKALEVNAHRFKAGDIARIDLARLQLQRVQFESDVQNALVSLRTSKIQLLMLLDDRTPVDLFDVTGSFEFSETIESLTEFRDIALEARPDLRAAVQAYDQAKTNQQLAEANASTDPTVGIGMGRLAESSGSDPNSNSLRNYVGFSISIPLRIFDRNQGERLRTKLDINRTDRLRAAAEAQLYSDVDSAHAALMSTVALLKPYKEKYLDQALTVRDTMTFSYERGGASLLDFLETQRDYRTVMMTYLGLVGSYLTSAAQLNLAVGREVIQ
ncbi:MAG: TolC family protein [Syntrophobacterales bacterium]|jgi:cobalt-zinc-cadmium efflux system outer membrane protein|nr:TolC family protein [Syntrophobacterales bacterium]